MASFGPAPSLDKPDQDTALLASTIILSILGLAFGAARIWVRYGRSKSYGWDDHFICVTLMTSVVSLALTICMYENGYGKSMAKLEMAQVIAASKFSNFAVLDNGFAMASLKVSIGLSLLRLQLGTGMKVIIWGSIVISVICNLSVIIGTLFGCRPIEGIWNRGIDATCLPKTVNMVSSYVQTSGNIATDLFYSLGPIYYLQKVKVSVYNRWALRAVFLVGLSATACAVAKCFELPKLRRTQDPTHDGVLITIWARAELNAGLIAACVPPLKALFEQILREWFNVRSGLNTSTGGPSAYGRGDGEYGLHSIKRSRMSKHQTLTDDDLLSNGRMHGVAQVRGGKDPYQSADLESLEEEDQKHILKVTTKPMHSGDSEHGSGNSDLGEDGRGGDQWIMKRVDYTVEHEARSVRNQGM